MVQASPATDAIERAIQAVSPWSQLIGGAAAVAFGLIVTQALLRLLSNGVSRPAEAPPGPPFSAMPSGWPPFTRAVAWMALRLGHGPPRSFRPLLLVLTVLVWITATKIGAKLTGANPTAVSGELGAESFHAIGLTFALVAAVLLAFLTVWTRRFGNGVRDLGLQSEGIGGALLLALTLYVGWFPVQLGAVAIEAGARALLGWAADPQAAVAAFAGIPQMRSDLVVIGGIVLAAPLHEELLFRAVLLRYLRRLLTPTGAIVANALLFTALHDGGQLAVFALGLPLAWLMMRTGNLAAPLLFHIVHNGLTLFLIATTARTGQ